MEERFSKIVGYQIIKKNQKDPKQIDPITLEEYIQFFHWVIIGGESGPVDKIRKLSYKDCEHLIQGCDHWGVKVFFKQLGTVLAKYTNQSSLKGADFLEYPDEFKSLMRREMPNLPLPNPPKI